MWRQMPRPPDERLACPASTCSRGELRIEFFGSRADLLRHLFELSQAMVNDFGKFKDA